MAHSKDLAAMKEIALKFDYANKIDKTVTGFPVITYAQPHTAKTDRRQLVKATQMAMRCNLPVEMFPTHLINLCKTDEPADLKNLREDGRWKAKWNGVWILQSHGTADGVKIDKITSSIKFYDGYGKFILEDNNFKTGLLKTCYSASRPSESMIHSAKTVDLVSFLEELRELCNSEDPRVLISAATTTTVVPLSQKGYWGFPVLSPRYFIEDLSDAPKELAKYFTRPLEELRAIIRGKSVHTSEIKEDKPQKLVSIFSVAKPAFFQLAALNPNDLLTIPSVQDMIEEKTDATDLPADNAMSEKKVVNPASSKIEKAGVDNDVPEDNEEKKEDVAAKFAPITAKILPIDKKYEQTYPTLFWFKTGKKSHPAIANAFCWKIRSGEILSIDDTQEKDDLERIYTKKF